MVNGIFSGNNAATARDTAEDFSEWDSGYSAAAQSVNFSGSAAAVGDISATKPPSQSENPQYTFLAELDGSNDFPRFTAGKFQRGG